jgi:hypothetical protein
MPPRGLPLGGLSSIFNSQLSGFEPVYSTCSANRLLVSGRQTLSPCRELPLSPSHIITSPVYFICMGANPSMASIKTSSYLIWLFREPPLAVIYLFHICFLPLSVFIITQDRPVVKCFFKKFQPLGKWRRIPKRHGHRQYCQG